MSDKWSAHCRNPDCMHVWQLEKAKVKPGLRCPKCLRFRPVAYPPGKAPEDARKAARKKQEAALTESLKAKKAEAAKLEAEREPEIPKAPAETTKWSATELRKREAEESD